MIFFQVAIVILNALLAGGMLFVLFEALRKPNTDPPNKTRRVIGNVLIYLATLNLVGASLSKFAHVPQVVAEMNSLNMTDWKLTVVASLELLTGLLLVFKPLRSVGLLVTSAYVGGASVPICRATSISRFCLQRSFWAFAGSGLRCVIPRFCGACRIRRAQDASREADWLIRLEPRRALRIAPKRSGTGARHRPLALANRRRSSPTPGWCRAKAPGA
jgi:hypothetical protein